MKRRISDPEPSRKTKKAIASLHERYEIGLRANEETRTRKGRCKYGTSSVAHFASGDKTSKSLIYDSRQIASRYDRKAFQNLIELIKQHDAPLGPSHVIEFSRVTDDESRHLLEKKAALNHWSVNRLRQEISEIAL